jgi:superfamily II DNA or RNA helicase
MATKVILHNSLEINRAENPRLNIGELKRRFTYPNPRYAEARRLRISTYGMPQNICLLQDRGPSLVLARGLISAVITENPEVEIVDQTITRPVEFPRAAISLRDYQQVAADALLQKNQGLLVAPCGSGKTIMVLHVIRQRRQKTLVIAHTTDLLTQWRAKIEEFLGIVPGIIAGGKFDPSPAIVVGTPMSLDKHQNQEFLRQFGMIILDEAHHAPADSFRKVVSRFPARYRLGASATPVRADGLSFILHGVMGATVAEIKPEALARGGHALVPCIRAIFTNLYLPTVDDYGTMLAAITKDEARNNLILQHVIKEAREGHSCLVLSERIAHAQELTRLFHTRCPELEAAVITGKDSHAHRYQAIKSMNQGQIKVLFATRLAEEGLDIPRLSRLFLTCPIRSANKVTQMVGRTLRPYHGEPTPIIYDFIDDLVGLAESQYCSRKQQAYGSYQIEEVPYGVNDGSTNYTQATG